MGWVTRPAREFCKITTRTARWKCFCFFRNAINRGTRFYGSARRGFNRQKYHRTGGRIWTTTKIRSKCLGFAKIRSKSALLPVGWSADAHENPPNLPGWTRITSENSFPAHRKSSRIPEKFVFPMVVHAARCTEIAHFATNSWEASPSRRRNDQNHAAAIGVNRVFFCGG